MTKRGLLGLAGLGSLLLVCLGCAQLAEKPKSQDVPPVTPQQRPVLRDRYELREIRNGAYYGTALLDKQTGRVWTLGSSSKGGTVTGVSFSEAAVYPKPEAAEESEVMPPCPSNDPVGLLSAQPCRPLPPKTGDAK